MTLTIVKTSCLWRLVFIWSLALNALLPFTARAQKAAYQTMPATALRDSLTGQENNWARGPFVLRKKIVTGYLKLQGWDMRWARFDSVVFTGPVYIHCESLDYASFSCCQFRGPVTIKLRKRGGTVTLDSCRFYQPFSLAEGPIRLINMQECVFVSTADIRPTLCNDLRVRYCRFESEANFYQTAFDKADFESTRFLDDADFYYTSFGNRVNFLDATFLRAPRFNLTKLARENIFSRVHVNETIDLVDVASPPKGNPYLIELRGGATDKVRLCYHNFRLSGVTTYDDEYSNYQTLLARQKTDGVIGSYQKLDQEYLRSYAEGPRGSLFTYYLGLIWWDLGYDKARVFWWALGLVFLFSLISAMRLRHLLTRVYALPSLRARADQLHDHATLENRPPLANRWAHLRWRVGQAWDHYILALFFTGIVFFQLKLDVDHLHFDQGKWVSYVLLMYVIGLICTAFMFNYIVSV